ncbi:MAG: dihydrolipoyl dehydrogenase [Propionibacteriaceae bacterium]|jgi:dihydrolipoamide dehydrogenase|nr:dihydrolipoyl dehydrogenase [Propionibacteriaceae bacterium]
MTDHDVIVVGGGPGGYIAAERLAEAGRRVLLAEPNALGGACLNVGCIPTKSLLNSAKLYRQALDSTTFGVSAEAVRYDWGQIQAWKDKTVQTLVSGVGAKLRRLKVEVAPQAARFVAPGVIELAGQRHQADHIIVATGSLPSMPPIPGVEGNPLVLDSTALLSVASPPQRLAVIGGGVIGVEFASLFADLGVQVEVIEMLDEILPFMDADVAAKLRRAMPKVQFHLKCRVEQVEGSSVVYTDASGQRVRVEADLVLMAVGRRPCLEGWGAELSGLELTSRGVTVDDTMRTNQPGVWAVGDITGRSLLAHAAYRMGEIAAALIIDPSSRERGQTMRWDTIPWAVYGHPEAAGVGLTERECVKRGLTVRCVTVPLTLSGRFVAEHGLSASGVVKLVAEPDSGLIRGLQMIGPYAPETIWGVAGVLENEFSVDDLKQVVFPHPTVSEGIREAVWAWRG